jgi:hypothetical protein
MDVIDQIKEKLSRYPDVRYVASKNAIDVHPIDDTGFVVGLRVDHGLFTVTFDSGWHEEFRSEAEALNCFAFGLSPECRLSIVYHGSTPTKWSVEYWRDRKWIPDSHVGLLLIPFWRPRRTVHRQNHVVLAV